ncbi:MAG: hypothetical protein HZA81_00150 [Candidatus Taylorbacteria bacterium]|nr:hypothetical protein [Candidatus Taylorbacteria bacterium]
MNFDTTTPFGASYANRAIYRQMQEDFALSPDVLSTFIEESAIRHREDPLTHAAKLRAQTAVLFSERLYQATTILRGWETVKPFIESPDYGLSRFFGLDVMELVEEFRRKYRGASGAGDPADAAGYMREAIKAVVEGSFDEAIEIIKEKIPPPAA